MKKFFLNILLVVFVSSLQLLSQQFSPGSPEWLVDMFFSVDSFPQKSEYYTGEMLSDVDQLTIGEELKQGDTQILFYKINEADEQQTFAVELELNEQVIDFYCYIKNENGAWKIEAIRRFLLPGFIYSVYDSLSNLNSPSAADQNLIKTLQLFTMNDAGMKNYLSANVDALYDIVWYFNQKENEEVNKRLKALGCAAVFKDNRFSNCVFIQISDFERMEAGFIYALPDSDVPRISPEEFIYIEEVLPGWFIYRIM